MEINSSLKAYELFKLNINPYAEEVWLLALNTQLVNLKLELVFRGTVDHCLFHPRDIFRSLVLSNASAFIIAHNHPSNNVTPSEIDLDQTSRMYKLSLLHQIQFIDHLVVTPHTYFSMGDAGYFQNWAKEHKRKKTIY